MSFDIVFGIPEVFYLIAAQIRGEKRPDFREIAYLRSVSKGFMINLDCNVYANLIERVHCFHCDCKDTPVVFRQLPNCPKFVVEGIHARLLACKKVDFH